VSAGRQKDNAEHDHADQDHAEHEPIKTTVDRAAPAARPTEA
jgi:hypothetical protein